MLTSTRTVTVNAAFLQDVKEDNIHLHDLLATAAKILDPSSEVDIKPRALAELFQQIRDQLATHFSLEEAFGYFEDAIEVAPRLSEKAIELRSQHETLYLSISTLADDAQCRLTVNGGITAIPSLLNRFRSFCRNLKRHEDAECELIMDALYEELGVGD